LLEIWTGLVIFAAATNSNARQSNTTSPSSSYNLIHQHNHIKSHNAINHLRITFTTTNPFTLNLTHIHHNASTTAASSKHLTITRAIIFLLISIGHQFHAFIG